MKQIPNYADDRFNGQCVYCGKEPQTREHVPPRVFLDKPFPSDLPIVEACRECNNGFSMDEEYMACLIDSVISGSADPALVQREKIARILTERPSIAKRINDSRDKAEINPVFQVEQGRVRTVVEKIARGHALYELNLLLDEPIEVLAVPLSLMDSEQRGVFEESGIGAVDVWPEVGSRSMQRLLVVDDTVFNGWIEVQPERYRYAVTQSSGTEVRMVMSEYLACQVRWE